MFGPQSHGTYLVGDWNMAGFFIFPETVWEWKNHPN
jgi:hypothetical protein